MSNFQVQVLQLRDSAYQNGLVLGQQLRSNPIVKTFEMITREEIDVQEMAAIYRAYAPHLLDELQGISEGLGISWEKAAALFGGYDVPKTDAMGCSAMMTPAYYVRNYDFSPALYDGYFTLLQSNSAFATAGYNLQVIGRHDGVNQHGLTMGLHFVSNHGYTKGLSAWSAIRMILDTCTSVDEAILMLKEMPHAACYNFSLGDKSGNMAVVEASPELVQIRRDPEQLSCVNHFQVDQLAEKNRSVITGSLKRQAYFQSLRDKAHNHEEMFALFKDVQSPLFFTDYADLFGTLHTFSYAYENAKIMTSVARGSQILAIDFADWVRGNNIETQFLEGIIEENKK
ncbi:peptidase C45 [Brevibacillus invocatus]|uniref:Peptidase C45 n=1 Tax=Brevibacillus invocatus TaxID=173959 RepID=A0A3M8CH47_9BACL|nr:C45 family peptidase [Brevibacillus invocatus]RNB74978.1 peptidase C45 [Brevibacillus invocatus]